MCGFDRGDLRGISAGRAVGEPRGRRGSRGSRGSRGISAGSPRGNRGGAAGAAGSPRGNRGGAAGAAGSPREPRGAAREPREPREAGRFHQIKLKLVGSEGFRGEPSEFEPQKGYKRPGWLGKTPNTIHVHKGSKLPTCSVPPVPPATALRLLPHSLESKPRRSASNRRRSSRTRSS